MEIFYSQHGEDFLVNEMFNNKSQGFFVEIGCLDGVEYSNTYFFEKKGWKGICIEAHNDFISSLLKNREGSHIVHCAIGEENKDHVTFYANKVGSLSTLDKNEEERWRKSYSNDFYGFEEQKVPMKTLTTVFDELAVPSIDFISLDIEGYEVHALKGLDFNKYRPEVFIIEYKDENHKEQINLILLPNGYNYLGKIGCNMYYSLDSNHKKILNRSYGVIRLLHVDMDGNHIWHEANQLKPNLLRKLRHHLKRLFN